MVCTDCLVLMAKKNVFTADICDSLFMFVCFSFPFVGKIKTLIIFGRQLPLGLLQPQSTIFSRYSSKQGNPQRKYNQPKTLEHIAHIYIYTYIYIAWCISVKYYFKLSLENRALLCHLPQVFLNNL